MAPEAFFLLLPTFKRMAPAECGVAGSAVSTLTQVLLHHCQSASNLGSDALSMMSSRLAKSLPPNVHIVLVLDKAGWHRHRTAQTTRQHHARPPAGLFARTQPRRAPLVTPKTGSHLDVDHPE